MTAPNEQLTEKPSPSSLSAAVDLSIRRAGSTSWPGGEDAELVSAEPVGATVAFRRTGEPSGDPREHGIAGRVPE